jgi:hypothetical protein
MAVKFMIFFASRHTAIPLNRPRCPMQCEDHVYKFQDTNEAMKVTKAQEKSKGKAFDLPAPLEK